MNDKILQEEFDPYLNALFTKKEIEHIHLLIKLAYEMGGRDQIKIEMKRIKEFTK